MNSADRNASWRRPPVVSLAGAALLLLFAVPLPAVAQEPSSGSRVAEGARVYGNMCGRCHNPRSPLERDDRSWITIINHMRVRGNLTGGQVKDVLAFLQGTNNDPSQVSPIAAATGPTARHLGPSDAPINAELADRGLASAGEAPKAGGIDPAELAVWTTMAMAFHRITARIRCSRPGSPGMGGSSTAWMVLT